MSQFIRTIKAFGASIMRVLRGVGDYFLRLLLAIDQLLNVLLCNGAPDETMSAASYRMNRDGRWWGWMMHVIDFLFIWQGPRHCYNAYIKELNRSQYPNEYQKMP